MTHLSSNGKMDDFVVYVPKPIIKNGVRIFRPWEYSIFRGALSYWEKVQEDALLLTGMRYVEAEKLQDNPDWFDGHFVNLPKGTSLKVKAKFDERTIRLSDAGRRVLPLFLKSEAKLPIRNTWDYVLKQRAEITNLKPDHYVAKDLGGVQQPIYGICAKSTRKTLASWLVYYLNSADRVHVPYSMGHDKETESEHYLNMPFVQEDRTGMEPWLKGWI